MGISWCCFIGWEARWPAKRTSGRTCRSSCWLTDGGEGPGSAWTSETQSVKCSLLVYRSFKLSASPNFAKSRAHKSSPNQPCEIKTLQSKSSKTNTPMTKCQMLSLFLFSSSCHNGQLISLIAVPRSAFQEIWYIPCLVTSCQTPQFHTHKSCITRNLQTQLSLYFNPAHQCPTKYCRP